jgi:hypothetical protein
MRVALAECPGDLLKVIPMPRWPEPDDDWDDPEDPEPDDSDDETDDYLIPCPYCRREIHEDSVRCQYCERYVSRIDAPPSRKPWWIYFGVGLCLYVVYRWWTVWR